MNEQAIRGTNGSCESYYAGEWAYTPKFVELGMPHPEQDYIAFEKEH